jgi:hypothetical protein
VALTLRALNRATLARQLLLARAAMATPDVVERLVGLQAQLPRPPFVGLWTRMDAFRREDLARAIRDRSIVRATFLRGTLHLVTARDFAALRGALQPALSAGLRAVLKDRAGDLDMPAVLAEARRFFGRSPRTFDSFRDHLAEAGAADVRGSAYAARVSVPLVQVPSDGPWAFDAAPDFALADAWIGRAIDESSDARPLVRRYLAAFGPASVTDMQAWSGHKSLKEAVDSLRPELVTLEGDGRRELFDLPGAPQPPEDTPAPPRFLPEFDNLLLSHANRRRVLADAHRSRVFLPGLRVAATFLVDGFVAGTWKATRTKAKATLLVEPFAALGKAVRAALADEGQRLLGFVEEEATAFDVQFAKPG